MGILKLFFILSLIPLALIAEESTSIKPCPSHDNFKQTWEFLTIQKDLDINDNLKMTIARKVSSGCDKAAENFKKIFILLVQSGVSHKVTLQSALEFSSLEQERATAFIEIFQALYLEKKFDLDFATSWKVALELSKSAKGNVASIMKDFVQTTDFCLSEKGLALSIRFCADIAIAISKSSYMYSKGLYQDMKSAFDLLTTHKKLGMSQRDSLAYLPGILSGGPGAMDNFKQNLEYTTSEKMGLPPKQALALATEMAIHSKRSEQ